MGELNEAAGQQAAHVPPIGTARRAIIDRAAQQFGVFLRPLHSIATGANVLRLDRKMPTREAAVFTHRPTSIGALFVTVLQQTGATLSPFFTVHSAKFLPIGQIIVFSKYFFWVHNLLAQQKAFD